MSIVFDALITLDDHHLDAAGVTECAADAATAVQRAIESIAGARWIDVAANAPGPVEPGWVTLYAPGRQESPDTADWRALQRTVEAAATAALVAAGAPF